jgi:RHS repeat-associated protein
MFVDKAGTTAAILDDNDMYPWGGVVPGVGKTTSNNTIKFTGQYRDTDTAANLDYFGARYYSNTIGRFMSPDWAAKPTTVPYAKFGDPQSLNLYSYVENGPINNIDVDGHWFDPECTACNQGDSGYGVGPASSGGAHAPENPQTRILNGSQDFVNSACAGQGNCSGTAGPILYSGGTIDGDTYWDEGYYITATQTTTVVTNDAVLTATVTVTTTVDSHDQVSNTQTVHVTGGTGCGAECGRDLSIKFPTTSQLPYKPVDETRTSNISQGQAEKTWGGPDAHYWALRGAQDDARDRQYVRKIQADADEMRGHGTANALTEVARFIHNVLHTFE